MKRVLIAAALSLVATAALAESHGGGDVAAGEKDYKKCKACHAIVDPDGEVIFKGGKVGPNLWGMIGRQAGTVEDFRYGASLVAAGEAGLVWTEEQLIAYATNPRAFLRDYLDDSGAKSKMTFRMKDATDVTAYLATMAAPAAE